MSDLVSEVRPPERDLDVQLRQVRALQMVDQVGGREDQPAIDALHPSAAHPRHV